MDLTTEVVSDAVEQAGLAMGLDPKVAQSLAKSVVLLLEADDEPEWDSQDVVRAADNAVWVRATRNQWRKVGKPGLFPHSQPERPLVLLDSPAARKHAEQERANQERTAAAQAQGFERGRNEGVLA